MSQYICEKTYIKLKGDPTAKYKREMVSILQDLKSKNVLTSAVYHKIYPTTDAPPKFYGLPKIHKDSIPLRPIVSNVDSITYNNFSYVGVIVFYVQYFLVHLPSRDVCISVHWVNAGIIHHPVNSLS